MSAVAAQPISASPPIVVQKALVTQGFFVVSLQTFSPLPASRTLGEEFDHKRKADFRTPMSFANECIRKPAALIQPTLFSTSTLDVILQRLMPLYRLRQTGESMTLLPSATHIDIATAMALWILGIDTSCGVCHPSMTTKVIRKAGCFYCNRHKLSETRIMSLMRSKIFLQCIN